MPRNQNPSYRHATRAELILINDKLREVITKIPGTDLVEYRAGWDDARVATELKVPQGSVAGMRTELYGKLINKPSSANVEALQQQVHELRVKYHKLVTLLALNRVADCRHLTLAGMDDPPKLVSTK